MRKIFATHVSLLSVSVRQRETSYRDWVVA